MVRTAKIADVELRDAARIGWLPAPLLGRVMAEIRANLGLNAQ